MWSEPAEQPGPTFCHASRPGIKCLGTGEDNRCWPDPACGPGGPQTRHSAPGGEHGPDAQRERDARRDAIREANRVKAAEQERAIAKAWPPGVKAVRGQPMDHNDTHVCNFARLARVERRKLPRRHVTRSRGRLSRPSTRVEDALILPSTRVEEAATHRYPFPKYLDLGRGVGKDRRGCRQLLRDSAGLSGVRGRQGGL